MVAVPRLDTKGSRKAEMCKSKFRDSKKKEQELGVHLRTIVFKRTGVQSHRGVLNACVVRSYWAA